MAYSDSVGDNAELLKRSLTRVTDFSGRSRRTEVIYLWIAVGLASVMLNIIVTTIVPWPKSLMWSEISRVVLAAPIFAQFVRRLHDQDRSGWWGLLLPLALLLGVAQAAVSIRGAMPDASDLSTNLGMLSGLCGMPVFFLSILPGTEGANRYGPDPRLEDL